MITVTCRNCGKEIKPQGQLDENGMRQWFDWRTGKFFNVAEAQTARITCRDCFTAAVNQLVEDIGNAGPDRIDTVFQSGMAQFGPSERREARRIIERE